MTAVLEGALEPSTQWRVVCRLDDLLPGRGVCALLDGHQVAIFRLRGRAGEEVVYAVGNYDPYGRANVISRGIVGNRGEAPTVASPLYKQVFDLRTGLCLDDPDGAALPTYPARVVGDAVEIALP